MICLYLAKVVVCLRLLVLHYLLLLSNVGEAVHIAKHAKRFEAYACRSTCIYEQNVILLINLCLRLLMSGGRELEVSRRGNDGLAFVWRAHRKLCGTGNEAEQQR